MFTKEVSITYEQIAAFRAVAELYLRSAEKETNLYYCVDKMFKKLKKRHERYIDKQNAARRAHAMTDPKTKKLLISGGNYEYTSEGLNALDKALRELQYRKVTVKAEMVPEDMLPESLKFEFQAANGSIQVCSDYEVRSAFAGVVFEAPGQQEDEEEEETDD